VDDPSALHNFFPGENPASHELRGGFPREEARSSAGRGSSSLTGKQLAPLWVVVVALAVDNGGTEMQIQGGGSSEGTSNGSDCLYCFASRLFVTRRTVNFPNSGSSV
jgi:hypothetical protein